MLSALAAVAPEWHQFGTGRTPKRTSAPKPVFISDPALAGGLSVVTGVTKSRSPRHAGATNERAPGATLSLLGRGYFVAQLGYRFRSEEHTSELQSIRHIDSCLQF